MNEIQSLTSSLVHLT